MSETNETKLPDPKLEKMFERTPTSLLLDAAAAVVKEWEERDRGDHYISSIDELEDALKQWHERVARADGEVRATYVVSDVRLELLYAILHDGQSIKREDSQNLIQDLISARAEAEAWRACFLETLTAFEQAKDVKLDELKKHVKRVIHPRCTWCGYVDPQTYPEDKPEQLSETAIAHYRTCEKSPLVQEAQKLRAIVRELAYGSSRTTGLGVTVEREAEIEAALAEPAIAPPARSHEGT